MKHSENLNELAAALAKAQRKIEGAEKNSLNPHFKSKYADLDAVWEACREALTSEGLSVIQSPGTDGNRVVMHTMLLQSSGQWISGELGMVPQNATPQAVGSAITYARRYALAAMAGVAPEDDDGNAASESSGHTSQPRSAPRAAPAHAAKANDPTTAFWAYVNNRKIARNDAATVVQDCDGEFVTALKTLQEMQGDFQPAA